MILTKPNRKVANSTYNLIGIGDSNSINTGTISKPLLQVVSENLLAHRGIVCTYKPFGLSGYSWNYRYPVHDIGETMNQLIASQVLTEIDPSMTNIIVASLGTNGIMPSLGDHSAATEYTEFQAGFAIIQPKLAANVFLINETIMPREDNSTHNSRRLTLNDSYRSHALSNGYAIADSGAANHIGTAGDEDNTTYFQDKIHSTDTGVGIRAALIEAQVP